MGRGSGGRGLPLARLALLSLSLSLVTVVVAGCNRGEGNAKDLAVSSDKEARVVVEGILQQLGDGHVEDVVARFCDQTALGRTRALELLEPARSRPGLVIVRSEPAWVGAEPFFYVEVGDPGAAHGARPARPTPAREPGQWVHGFGVRVRDGCLDRAVGATVLPDRKRRAPEEAPPDESAPAAP